MFKLFGTTMFSLALLGALTVAMFATPLIAPDRPILVEVATTYRLAELESEQTNDRPDIATEESLETAPAPANDAADEIVADEVVAGPSIPAVPTGRALAAAERVVLGVRAARAAVQPDDCSYPDDCTDVAPVAALTCEVLRVSDGGGPPIGRVRIELTTALEGDRIVSIDGVPLRTADFERVAAAPSDVSILDGVTEAATVLVPADDRTHVVEVVVIGPDGPIDLAAPCTFAFDRG